MSSKRRIPKKKQMRTYRPAGSKKNASRQNQSILADEAVETKDALQAETANPLRRQEQILQMQRLFGNSMVRRYLAGETSSPDSQAAKIMREDDKPAEPKNLKEALGYRPSVSVAAVSAGAMHPMTASIVLGMNEMLEAAVLEKNKDKAGAIYRNLSKTTGNLKETLRRLGDVAPDRALWFSEYAAWTHILGEVESGFWKARRGSWSKGMDAHWMRMMVRVDKRLIMSMSPFKATAKQVLPGGTIKRKVPLGTYPVIGAILNVYANLEITKKPTKSASGASAAGKVEVDEEGKLKPGVSASLEGAKGAKVTGAATTEGAEVSGETGKVDVGGGSVSGAAKIGSKGGEVSNKVEDPSGWSHELKATTDGGLSFKTSHPKAGGVELSGALDKFTLQAMAPEITLGDVEVKASLEIEIIPAPHFWPKTFSQKSDVLEFYKTYKMVVLVLAGVVIAAPVAAAGAAAAAEALPGVLIVLGEKAPALILAPAL